MPLRTVSLALLCILLGAAALDAAERPGSIPKDRFVVFLLIGHSNMYGEARGVSFPIHPRLWMRSWRGGDWQPARPRGHNGDEDAGPEMFILTELAERYPDYHFGYIKVAKGGATVREDFMRGQGRYDAVIRNGQWAKQHATLGGVIAMLGFVEATSHGGWEQFQENIVTMMGQMREDLDEPDLPLVIGKFEEHAPGEKYDLKPEVRRQMTEDIDALPSLLEHTAVVDTDGPYRDDHHFTAEGMRLWGTRAAEILVERGWAVPSGVSPIRVTLAAPAEEARFDQGAPIELRAEIDGQRRVSKVVFHAGDRAVAEAAAAPWTATWSGAAQGVHAVRAEAVTADGASAFSDPVRIAVGADVPSALLVTGHPAPSYGERLIAERLASLGFLVHVREDDQVASADAEGHALVVATFTVDGIHLRKFADSDVPVLAWNDHLHELNLIVAEPQDIPGGFPSDEKIVIVSPEAPLAAGFPAGEVVILTDDKKMAGVVVPQGAPVIAGGADKRNRNRAMMLAYDAGWQLPRGGGTAPARRVGIFFGGFAGAPLNENGWKLIDASVRWAVGR